jgi:hypothetical protein
MKPTDFKKIIKDAVKEAIQEELKDIILEAVRTPKSTPSGNMRTEVVSENIISAPEKRQRYMDILNETAGFTQGSDTISMNSSNIFRPTGTNTAAEGSSLPPGEVDMSQIISLLNSNR